MSDIKFLDGKQVPEPLMTISSEGLWSDIKFLDGKQVPEPLMTISSEGLWVNPAIPADETARLVVKSIDASIKLMVASAVRREREECAKVCEEMPWISGQSLPSNNEMAAAIRARGESK